MKNQKKTGVVKKKVNKNNAGGGPSGASQNEDNPTPKRNRIQELISQGNALDSKAQRDIAILNLHHKKGKKTVRNKQGKVVTSHRTNQKVAAFQNKIQSHEDQQAEYLQYSNRSKSPPKRSFKNQANFKNNNIHPNSRVVQNMHDFKGQ